MTEDGLVQRDLGTLHAKFEANIKTIELVHSRMDDTHAMIRELKDTLIEQHAACAKKTDVDALAAHVGGLAAEHGNWKFGAKIIGGVGLVVMGLVNREKLAAMIGKIF